jgi:hypothetical protein
MIGVCPGCGKPFKIEKAESGEVVYCEDVKSMALIPSQ